LRPQPLSLTGISFFDLENGTIVHLARTPDGTITTFDVLVTGGTFPIGINPSGAITGYYVDASGVPHGFLRSK
jgi:hypothetical protein